MNMLQDKKLTKTLFYSILLMFLPIAISKNILNDFSYRAPMYSIVYVVQLFLLLIALNNIKAKIRISSILIVILYSIILIIPLFRNSFKNIITHNFDYFNMIIKILNIFVFYVLFRNISVSKESIITFMQLIVKASIIACLFSLVFEIKEIISIPRITNTNLININSFFANRNQFSSFLLTGIIANLFIVVNKKNKRLNYILFGLQIFFILITFSRGAIFSVASIIIMLILQYGDYKKFVGIFLAIILILTVFLSTGIFDYILKNFIRSSNFDSGRKAIWSYGYDIIGENYLTGVGRYTGISIAQSKGMELSEFHNMYMEFFVNGGIIEIVFIFMLIGSIYINLIRRCPDNDYIKIFRIAYLVFFMRGAVESLSIFSLGYSDTIYTIFYITLPLLISNIKVEPEEDLSIE